MPRALAQKLHFILVSLLIQHRATLKAPTQFAIKVLALQQVIMAHCQLALTRQMDLGYMTYMVISVRIWQDQPKYWGRCDFVDN